MPVPRLKHWQRERNADEQALAAVMDDPDLLTLILASVGPGTDEHPLRNMGVTRRVCKQWNKLGLTTQVRRAYCAMQDWRELPRWCCPHISMPGCVCQGCNHVDLKANWFTFETYCAHHNVVMLLPPMPPKKIYQARAAVGWMLWDPAVIDFAALFPHAVTLFEVVAERRDGSTGVAHTILHANANRASKTALKPNLCKLATRQRIRLQPCLCSASNMPDRLMAERAAQAKACLDNKVCRWTPWSDYCEPAEMDAVRQM